MALQQGEKEAAGLFDHWWGGDSVIGHFPRFRGELDEDPPSDVVLFVREGMILRQKGKIWKGKPKNIENKALGKN